MHKNQRKQAFRLYCQTFDNMTSIMYNDINTASAWLTVDNEGAAQRALR